MKASLRFLTLCAILGVLLITPLSTANADEAPTTLRVAFCELDGFFEYDAEGNPSGYGVDLLDEVSGRTGIKFEYVPASSWEQTKTMLLAGEADVRMPGTLPSTPSTTLGYTSESVMDTCRVIMTSKSRDDLYYKDYDTFGSLKIAMVTSLYENTDVREYLDDVGVSSDNLVLRDDFNQCRQALDDGEVDAVISNIMDLTDDLKMLARFNSVSNYLSMTIGNPYLDVLDAALNEIKMDNPTFLPALYQKYYPERSVVPYTREEAEYVRGAGTIVVGQLEGRSPFYSVDGQTSEASGMFVDLCDLIAQKSGLTFSYQNVPTGVRAVDWLGDSGGDLVAGVMYSSLTSPSVQLISTDVAFSSSMVIVCREDEPFSVDDVRAVALPRGFIGGQEYVASAYPNAAMKTYDDNEACLEAIASGEADIMLQDVYVARAALQSPRFDALAILPAYQVEESMRLVMLDSEDPLLLSVLNKAIDSITEDELNDIVAAHTVAKPYQITLMDVMVKYRTQLLIIAAFSFVVLFLLVAILVLRQRSARRIEAKNVQLSEAYEQVQSASRAKSDFLSRMSHEIRTPMNAIVGIAALAQDHVDEPKEIERDLDRITVSSKVLLSIINDVLDMSAIESDKLRIDRRPFDFKTLVSSLSTVYFAQCRAKGVAFEVEFANVVDEQLEGDPLRVNQVLMNLLSNAVKFTDRGTIRLVISQRTVQHSKAFVRFEVSDTGCGMDEALLERLWQPFEQESARTAQEHGGSGLGLSIVKSLVALMGGAVEVETERGVGTTFTVDLPFGRCGQDGFSPIEGAKKLRALVIDDAKDARDYTSAVLERIGVACACAASGEEALDLMARAEAEGAPFNVCIVDWKMPGIDGAEVTRRIRERYGHDATVIVASAYDRVAAEDAAREAGADRFVEKPLFQSTMFDLFSSLSNGRLVKGSFAPSDEELSGRRVLLAENNNMNRIVAVGLLKKVGVSCETANNGQVALEMFESAAPGHYDAVLMDVQMPVMDGYAATRAIRALDRPDAATVPILALTANAFTEDIAEALQSGMNDHVAKPIELDVLAATLSRALRQKEE